MDVTDRAGKILNEEVLKLLGLTPNAVAKAIDCRPIGLGGRRQMAAGQPGSFPTFREFSKRGNVGLMLFDSLACARPHRTKVGAYRCSWLIPFPSMGKGKDRGAPEPTRSDELNDFNRLNLTFNL